MAEGLSCTLLRREARLPPGASFQPADEPPWRGAAGPWLGSRHRPPPASLRGTGPAKQIKLHIFIIIFFSTWKQIRLHLPAQKAFVGFGRAAARRVLLAPQNSRYWNCGSSFCRQYFKEKEGGPHELPGGQAVSLLPFCLKFAFQHQQGYFIELQRRRSAGEKA